MKTFLQVFCVVLGFNLPVYSFSETLPASQSDLLVSKVMAEILTTETGCEIVERFFLLDENHMQHYFGINSEAAHKISQSCPGTNKPSMSFLYYIPESKRPAKTYSLQIDSNNRFFMGWTSTKNETQIIMKKLDEGLLRQILAHELVVTMDDKFGISYEDFKLFNFRTAFPAVSHCKINRFLANPFYQAALTGLRAYRMELLFAQNLGDSVWLEALSKLKVIQADPRLSFKNMVEVLWPVRHSLMSFYQDYQDSCRGQKQKINVLRGDEVDNLILRDFEEIQSELSTSQLFDLLQFLTFEIAISSSDSNIVNFGPRPNIGSGGWSLKIKDFEQIQKLVPQRELGAKDMQFEWTKVHSERFRSLDANKSKIESVPVTSEIQNNK